MSKYVIRVAIKSEILYIGKDVLVLDVLNARVYTYYDALKEAEQWKQLAHIVNVLPFEKAVMMAVKR